MKDKKAHSVFSSLVCPHVSHTISHVTRWFQTRSLFVFSSIFVLSASLWNFLRAALIQIITLAGLCPKPEDSINATKNSSVLSIKLPLLAPNSDFNTPKCFSSVLKRSSVSVYSLGHTPITSGLTDMEWKPKTKVTFSHEPYLPHQNYDHESTLEVCVEGKKQNTVTDRVCRIHVDSRPYLLHQ